MFVVDSSLRRRIIGLLLTLCASAVLLACSTVRFGYGQATSFSYWWMDSYLDFSEAQAPRVRSHLAAFFDWHRGTQLPDYATLLERARGEVLSDTTPQRVCEWADQAGERIDTSLARMLPGLADVGRTLSPQQLQHMAQKFAKTNAEFSDEFLQPDRARRHKASIKRAVERAEWLYGSLARPQRELLNEGIKASPFDPELWLAERQLRQQEILKALKAMPAQDPAEAQRVMGALVRQFRQSPRPAYAAYEEKLMQYNCALAARLHNSTTPQQRQDAADRLRGWEEDMRVLAAAARPAS